MTKIYEDIDKLFQRSISVISEVPDSKYFTTRHVVDLLDAMQKNVNNIIFKYEEELIPSSKLDKIGVILWGEKFAT